MSEPMVWCETCGRTRNPYLHVRSQRVPPPIAALHWLIKTCSLKDPVGEKPCDISYQAGLGLGFTAPQGQQSATIPQPAATLEGHADPD